MQQRADANLFHFSFSEVESSRDGPGELTDAAAVTGRVGVTGIQGIRQRADEFDVRVVQISTPFANGPPGPAEAFGELAHFLNVRHLEVRLEFREQPGLLRLAEL